MRPGLPHAQLSNSERYMYTYIHIYIYIRGVLLMLATNQPPQMCKNQGSLPKNMITLPEHTYVLVYSPAAVWRWIGSCIHIFLCFVIYRPPLVPFGHLFLFFGRRWAPFERQLLTHIRIPWDAMEVALVCLGIFSIFLTKLDDNF